MDHLHRNAHAVKGGPMETIAAELAIGIISLIGGIAGCIALARALSL